jgi:hypothetical protein
MAITFEQALRKSIKAYFEGLPTLELSKSGKKSQYTKKYFDKVGKEFGIEPIGKSTLKDQKDSKNGK